MFQKIKIKNFRCFNDNEIALGKYLTVLAGRNSTGKSTILGMLGNAAEIKKKDGTTYSNGQFRAEFSELFNGSEKYDLKGSNRYEIDICDDDGQITDYRKFRITWQKKNKYSDEKRFHIVPYKQEDGIKTSAKLNIPVLYLGLSRLFPIGEADEEKMASTSIKFRNDDHMNWFYEKYKRILSIHSKIESISETKISETEKKHAIGVNTDKYDYLANSSGQDNLGQILFALLSYKNIKENWSGPWPGGLLLIDEIDATLHPAAQNRLIEVLLSEARAMDIQIVVTTHSMSLLKYITIKTKYNEEGKNNKVELYYFSNANRSLEIKRNLSYPYIESDLLIEPISQQRRKIKVYSEDEENRWFLKNLIGRFADQVDMLDVSIGCDELIKLYKVDSLYFGNTIISLDGDVKDNALDKVPLETRKRMNNIIRLPGDCRPEEVFYNYLLSLQPEHPYWVSGEKVGFSWDYFKDNGPDSSKYSAEKERERYKRWFSDNMDGFNDTNLFSYWEQDNLEVVEMFVRDFINVYNSVANRQLMSLIDIEE